MALQFDLGSFTNNADRELLQRLPQRVASYYLALPVASEGDRVTVVTAYPDNIAALGMLERLLRAEIVPVSSSEDALQEAIARIYPESAPVAQSMLVWTDDPDWCESVVMTAQAFGRALGQRVHILDTALSLGDVIDAAGRPDVALLVTHVSDEAALARLVHESPASLLLVRGEYVASDSLLIALRGYASDHQALELVLPMIAQEHALATVLPLARTSSTALNELLTGNSPARQHLQTFLQELGRQDIQVTVRLRPGDALSQVVAELSQATYGLLVIAAEAEGRFVWQMLSRIDHENTWPGRPVLVVKPPVGVTTLSE